MYYTKIIKMTSTEAILVTLMPTLNIFLSTAIVLEVAMQNNVSSLRDFTHDAETYDIGKLYLSLDSSFFSV